jgi:hypothetical protein
MDLECEWRRNEKSEDERWEKQFIYTMNDVNHGIVSIQQKPFHSVETIGQTVWDGVRERCRDDLTNLVPRIMQIP